MTSMHRNLFWSLKEKIQPSLRTKRMKKFISLFSLQANMRICDLGGATGIWDYVLVPLDITIVNLPNFPVVERPQTRHRFTLICGDATHLPELADNSFDLVFSNSVIEHVGDASQRYKFATEARRLAPSYFVQTPSIWFPLEPHSGVPFSWFLPRGVRALMHRNWAKSVPGWNEMIEGTTVISVQELKRLFPDGDLLVERWFGFPKSNTVFRKNS